jgi:uncharacterized membrane protein YhfC
MDILFWAHFFNGFLMIAMPIGLAIFLTHNFKLGWRLWWIGAATFVLSQVGHIPFNWVMSILLNKTALVNWPHTAQTIFNVVFLGLSAGLWEECARYTMYRWWVKDARSWRKGLLAGAGHGSAEAILLGALALYAFIQLVITRNLDLSSLVPANQLALARQQVATFWSATWYDSLLGAVERLLAMPVQICLAVIVLQTFTRKQWFWVWLAVAYHAITDAVAVYVVSLGFKPWVIEGFVGIFSIFALIIIFTLRQPEPPPAQDGDERPSGPQPAEFTPGKIEETQENMERTRYQ